MTPKEVLLTVRMTGHDFRTLSIGTYAWEGRNWKEHGERFIVYPYDRDTAVSYDWLYAHWFDRWIDVMHARTFLGALGEGYQILSDECDGEFVVVTNYYGPDEDNFLRPKKEGVVPPSTSD